MANDAKAALAAVREAIEGRLARMAAYASGDPIVQRVTAYKNAIRDIEDVVAALEAKESDDGD